MKMKINMLRRFLILLVAGILSLNTVDIKVTGVKYLDTNAIVGLSGIRKYSRILVPGDAITSAVQKLWEQGLFSDVKIRATDIRSDTIFLEIQLAERARISSVEY